MDEDFPESETYYTNKPYDKLQVNFVGIKSICDQCTAAFSFQSTLDKHIRTGCIPLQESIAEIGSDFSSARPNLKCIAKLSVPGSGLPLRDWSYVTTSITLDLTASPSLIDTNSAVCLDTGCGVTLVDRTWLARKLSSQKISAMLVLLKIRDIDASKQKAGNFALTTIYLPSIDKKSREVYVSINCKLHLVDGLKANMLMGNNVLCIEGFAINLSTSSTLIHSCGMKIDIDARQHSNFLKERALASAPIIMPSQSEALGAFQHIELPDSHDFLFHLFSQQHLTLYSHILDHTNLKIFVYNNANHAIKIPTHYWLASSPNCLTRTVLQPQETTMWCLRHPLCQPSSMTVTVSPSHQPKIGRQSSQMALRFTGIRRPSTQLLIWLMSIPQSGSLRDLNKSFQSAG